MNPIAFFRLAAALALLASVSASAGPQPPKPDARTFLAETDARVKPRPAHVPHLKTGQTGYLPLSTLIRGQDEISVDNSLAKLEERLAAGQVHWNEKNDHWMLGFDQGRSPVPIDDPISVVLGPQGPVIVDGHHDAYLALYLGAETILVRVVADLSDLSPTEFWNAVKLRELVLLAADPATLAASPPDLRGVQDNPNRYLASQLALKATVRLGEDGGLEVLFVKGNSKAVWIKVNESIPFVEFYLARALSDAGIHYDPRWGKNIPPDVIEAARRALNGARAAGKITKLNPVPLIESADVAIELARDKQTLARHLEKTIGFPELCHEVFAN